MNFEATMGQVVIGRGGATQTTSGTVEVEGTIPSGDPNTAKPVIVGAEAVSTLPVPVDAGDAVELITTLQKQLIMAGFDLPTNANRAAEVDPLDEHITEWSLADDNNILAAATPYPSASGFAMRPFKNFSISGEISVTGATETIEMQVEVTNDEDLSGSPNWVPVFGYGDHDNATLNKWDVTDGTLEFAISFNSMNYRYVRVVVTPSINNNVVVIKGRRVAL